MGVGVGRVRIWTRSLQGTSEPDHNLEEAALLFFVQLHPTPWEASLPSALQGLRHALHLMEKF